jgi:P27 family predicted phage terminase small subunit
MAVQEPAPAGLKPPGKRLWRAVTGEFRLNDAEKSLLLQCCQCADELAALKAIVDAEGVMAESSQGSRVHPAQTELRQLRLAYQRLVAGLGLPIGLEEEKPQKPLRSLGKYGLMNLEVVPGG